MIYVLNFVFVIVYIIEALSLSLPGNKELLKTELQNTDTGDTFRMLILHSPLPYYPSGIFFFIMFYLLCTRVPVNELLRFQ